MLTKDQILKADDIKREKVPVPEWGGDLFVRVMSGRERDGFEAETMAARDAAKGDVQIALADVTARLLVRTICDEAGKPLFVRNDVAALGAKSCAALNRIYDVAARLNRLGAKDVEELLGKSESGPSAASG